MLDGNLFSTKTKVLKQRLVIIIDTMPKYNIIYISPDNDHYLWTGTSLDKLEKTGQELLRFSGKDFKEEELTDGIKAAKVAAGQAFPDDDELKVKTVEIKVSD